MAQAARLNLRMQKELKLLLTDPPPGASFPSLSAPQTTATSSSSSGPSLSSIEAQIEGPEGTVYAKGYFKLKIQIPDRYPFQPPTVTFATPIYHPNIDNGGRICLDILNLPPKGAWQPSLNISTVLTSIGLLLSEPNPDDGLMHEASQEYKYNRQAFDQKARSMTEKYAGIGACDIASGSKDSQTILNLSTDFDEAKGSDKSMQEVNRYLVGNKRLCGISRKLSLESPELDQERMVGKRVNELSSEHLSGRQREFTGLKQDSKGMPSEQIQAHKSPQRMSKKLSWEASVSFHVEKDNYINDIVSSEGKSTSTTDCSKPLPLPQAGSNFQQNPSQCDERSISKSGPTKLEKKELLQCLDSNKRMVDDQVELLFVAQQSSVQCHSFGTHKNFPLPQINSQNGRESHSEFIDGDGSSLLRIKHKKLGLTGRRISSGMLVTDHSQGKDDTENLAPSSSFPLGCSSKNPTPSSILLMESGAGHCHDKSTLNYTTACLEHRQPLKPLSQSSNSNDVNAQPEMESLNASMISTAQNDSCYNEKLQAKQDCIEKFAVGIKKQEEVSPSYDTDEVIVLDSEDSDEDQGRPARSKLSLARRRLPGKLK